VNSLFSSFLELPSSTSSGELKALPLSAKRKDFLAKNENGSPLFLLHDSGDAKYNPGINFRHLSAEFHTTCRIQLGTTILEDQFCLVWCDGAAPELHELFVSCVSAAIEELSELSATRELEACISRLGDLFRTLAQPSGREISGLWAELFVIAKCGNPAQALALWHDDQFDRFDFSSDSMCLEIKSTVRGLRAHEFALEQLHPPEGGEGFVVSVLLQPLTGGLSVLDLARAIESSVVSNPRLKQKIWQNVAKALGADFSDRLDRRFDPSSATRSLAIYSMTDIPQPGTPNDTRITALRFVSDLTSVTTSLVGDPATILARCFLAN
jgi:hypothetical protein